MLTELTHYAPRLATTLVPLGRRLLSSSSSAQLPIERLHHLLKGTGAYTISSSESVSKAYNFPRRCNAGAHIKLYSAQQASVLLKWAREEEISVIPQGGNTSLVEGATPSHNDSRSVIVTVGKGACTIDKDTGLLTVNGGITVLEAQQVAEEHGLCLPMEYGSKGSATMLASIATRAMGMRAGSIHVAHSVVMVDGTGERHDITFEPGLVLPKTSVLPGKGKAWPFANQGFLGLGIQGTFRLCPANQQEEVAFIGVHSPADALQCLTQLQETLRHTPGSVQFAELMYANAVQNVSTIANPLEKTPFPFYLLVKLGSTEPAHVENLRETAETALMALYDTMSLDLVLAETPQQQKKLVDLREELSDAARKAAAEFGYTPIPFDISCDKTETSYVLAALDHFADTLDHKKNIFGHLNQDQTTAVIHYNLAVKLPSDPAQAAAMKQEIEATITQIVYTASTSSCRSHSGEHGGLGSKNLGYTIQHTPKEDLKYFTHQIQKFNPFHTLQTSRTKAFLDLYAKQYS